MQTCTHCIYIICFARSQIPQVGTPRQQDTRGILPAPPFRLSHLHTHLDALDSHITIGKLIEGSKETLNTLTIHGFGLSPSSVADTVADTVAMVARTPLPNLRHLTFLYYDPAIIQLFPFLPSLRPLSIRNLFNASVTSVVRALPPSLSTLRLHRTPTSPSRGFDNLRLSIATLAAGSLRQLHLSAEFRAGVDDGAWGKFEEECQGSRSVRVLRGADSLLLLLSFEANGTSRFRVRVQESTIK